MTLAGVSSHLAERLLPRSAAVIAGYVAALFLAEVLLAQAGFLVGGISHLLLLVMLIGHHATTDDAAYRPILLALTLPPLMRLVSLTVTVVDLPVLFWFIMIAIPTLLATVLVLRVTPVPLAPLVARPANAPIQVVIALSGIVHGLLLTLILMPAAIVSLADPASAFTAAVVLLLCVAIVEEVIFRGIVQSVALEITGSRAWAVGIAGIVYACMFVSADSFLLPLAMLVVGTLFGVAVAFTKSLWGVIGAHASMSIGVLIVWPAVLA